LATAKKAAAKKTSDQSRPVATAPAAEPTKSIDPAPLVDELFEIQTRLAPYRKDIAREEALKSIVRGLTDDNTSHVPGAKAIAVLGPRQNKTIVAYYDLARRIGLDAYAQIATVTLEALAKVAKPGIVAQYIRTESTGTRPLMVIEKGGAK
jgi:hypothetical protein